MGNVLTRIGRAWRAAPAERRLAATAAVLLFATMFLPWYQQNVVVSGDLASANLTAFQVFSFVEAAVLLVAIAVLVLLFARAEGRAFHLPGGDGAVVTLAGGWAALLLVWRLFDKPELQGDGVGNMGVQWGIFFALGAAALLATAGVRMRATDRRPPLPPVRDPQRPPRPPAPPGTERTQPLAPERTPVPRDEPPAAEPPTLEAPTDPLPRRTPRRRRRTDHRARLWDDL